MNMVKFELVFYGIIDPLVWNQHIYQPRRTDKLFILRSRLTTRNNSS